MTRLLADPVARGRLREFAGSTVDAGKPVAPATVQLKTDGKTVVYQPIIVAKAA